VTSVLLFGSTGQIGRELARALRPIGNVVAPPRNLVDFVDPEAVGRYVDTIRPKIIVNAAAYTDLDGAEADRDRAYAINAYAPAELARSAVRHRALLVHYSTDCVFDGASERPYTEDDAPNPQSVYGRSKLMGEQALRESGADHIIFRTSWVFAACGRNFLSTIVRLAREREELRIVADRLGAPTWTRLVAEYTALALRQDLARRTRSRFESGTVNLTSSGETSWYDFACAILSAARALGQRFECRTVVPITGSEEACVAGRPANSRLSGALLGKRYGLQLPDWKTGMRQCLEERYAR